MDLTDIDIGYCAGFFDGEGSAMMINFKGKKMIKLAIANTVKEPIFLLKKQFPKCSVYTYQPKGAKKNGQPYKLIWTFQLSGKTAREFLTIVKPHLLVKRDKAEELLKESDY